MELLHGRTDISIHYPPLLLLLLLLLLTDYHQEMAPFAPDMCIIFAHDIVHNFCSE